MVSEWYYPFMSDILSKTGCPRDCGPSVCWRDGAFLRLVPQLPNPVPPNCLRVSQPCCREVNQLYRFACPGPYSITEKSDEKRGPVSVDSQEVDTGAQLDASLHAPLDPAEALKIRWAENRPTYPTSHVHIQFMDKVTLGNSSILGILKAAHLNANQLGTIFYLGYLAFEFPQNLALQRFPVGKWMSLNIFIWGVALCCHAACKSFAGLFVLRLILGVCEGSITAGFLIVSSMFYTRREQTARVGYWFLMNGIGLKAMSLWSRIIGFISFGILHIHTTGLQPCMLMIITGTLTLITAITFLSFPVPGLPHKRRFLTEDERAKAVRRIKENQTGVENKRFKKEQMIEAFMDPRTWSHGSNIMSVRMTGKVVDDDPYTNNQHDLYYALSVYPEDETSDEETGKRQTLRELEGEISEIEIVPNLIRCKSQDTANHICETIQLASTLHDKYSKNCGAAQGRLVNVLDTIRNRYQMAIVDRKLEEDGTDTVL
ncbi:major facilitator superfamily domain-containing protein [Russula emetica]|nr:major facilitator superfamily domain-containing protein [Russula emetica]